MAITDSYPHLKDLLLETPVAFLSVLQWSGDSIRGEWAPINEKITYLGIILWDGSIPQIQFCSPPLHSTEKGRIPSLGLQGWSNARHLTLAR